MNQVIIFFVLTCLFVSTTTFNFQAIKNLICMFGECCNNKAIPNNITDFQLRVSKNLYGQKFVLESLMPVLRSRSSDHGKPSLILFHGPVGVGKSYVSRMIAESLYMNGMKSRFVNSFISTVHFTSAEKKDLYRENLVSLIKEKVSECPQQLFIFDEVDKAPSGVLDAIQPFIDDYGIIDGIDFKKTIFIFISNAGGKDIIKYVTDKYRGGYERNDIKLKDLEKLIIEGHYNNNNDKLHTKPWLSNLIKRGAISSFLPFLPLEKIHVLACARRYLREKRADFKKINESQVLENVIDSLLFVPEEESYFSISGCKRVTQKCDEVLERLIYRDEL